MIYRRTSLVNISLSIYIIFFWFDVFVASSSLNELLHNFNHAVCKQTNFWHREKLDST